MFTKKTVRDIDVQGKRVLVRVDYNVPMERGKIISDYRLEQSLPTIQTLLDKGASVVICSHLGRPEGKPIAKYSLKPVAARLCELLDRDVNFVDDCVGDKVREAVEALQPGQVLLLENLRFHKGEEANDDAFAAELAKNGEIFVQDGFGAAHRKHASTDAITRHLPSVAGLLLEKEVTTITRVMKNPVRPLAAVIGGVKISDKIEILNRLIDIADFVAVGGAMSSTFLAAKGVKVGRSKYDPDELNLAREIIAKAEEKSSQGSFVFFLPRDGVVATALEKNAKTRLVDWDAALISEVQNYPKPVPASAHSVASSEMIADIGPFSAAFIAGGVQLAGTVIWNGSLGVTEVPSLHGPIGPFAHGTELLVEALTGDFGASPFVLAGGGDTAGYIETRQLTGAFGHVSTGGGAFLDLLSGVSLPGVDALQDK